MTEVQTLGYLEYASQSPSRGKLHRSLKLLYWVFMNLHKIEWYILHLNDVKHILQFEKFIKHASMVSL